MLTEITPGLRRITAPNPGPMTGTGTQTYLLGTSDIAVIDPGPATEAHLQAILGAVRGARITSILITHGHLDHTALVPALVAETGAAVLAFGEPSAGRSALMRALADRPGLRGGEGLDHGFRPDARLADGDVIGGTDWAVRAVHTPGHLSSHLSFRLEDSDILFTGDTVMGWSTTLISPPDGSVSDFLQSLDRMMALPERQYLPGHGDPVADGPALAARQKAHRLERECQVLEALGDGARSLGALTAEIYHDVPEHLHRAAARNVLAHLVDLAEQGRVLLPEGPLDTGKFRCRTAV